MFFIDNDLTIHITRGDAAIISVSATSGNEGTADYEFSHNDVVRLKVFAKKSCEDVVLQKDTVVDEPCGVVEIVLDKEDTTVGEVISKPTDFWYEIELNPDTYPQTIVGYDEDGAKVFKVYPEGGAANE